MVAIQHLYALNANGTVIGGEAEPQGRSRRQVPSTRKAADSDDPPRRNPTTVVKKYEDSDDEWRPARIRNRRGQGGETTSIVEKKSTVVTSGYSVKETVNIKVEVEESASVEAQRLAALEVQRLTDLLASAESGLSLLKQQMGTFRSKLAVDRDVNRKAMQENEDLRNTLADMERKVALQQNNQVKVVETDTEISVRMKADWMQAVGTAIVELKTAKVQRERNYTDELNRLRAELARRQAPQSSQIPAPQGQPRPPQGQPQLPQGQLQPPQVQMRPPQDPALRGPMPGMLQTQALPGVQAGSPYLGGPPGQVMVGGPGAGTMQAMAQPGMTFTRMPMPAQGVPPPGSPMPMGS